MNKKPGDFTGLAENYSLYRPGYAPVILRALQGLIGKPWNTIDFADVGAGTGIWTRMVAEQGTHSAIAVEPNDDMRHFGEKDSIKNPIEWVKGNGENTSLSESSCDLVSMASSFHWVDFNAGTREFHRVLKPGGVFCALWNPRKIEENPLLVEIEDTLYEMAPHIKRVSSGRAAFTESLFKQLESCGHFSEVLYCEAQHIAKQRPEHYLGVWWSVNDIRAQAGEDSFKRFMSYVEDRIRDVPVIETTYLTRAWMAKVAK